MLKDAFVSFVEKRRASHTITGLLEAYKATEEVGDLEKEQIKPEELPNAMRQWNGRLDISKSLANVCPDSVEASQYLLEARRMLEDYFYDNNIWDKAKAMK